MAVVERTSNVLQLLWRGYKKAAFGMSQRCAPVHREAHASASPRLYVQAALFRAQMERGYKNRCWPSPSLQIQLYVWHRKLTKNCNLEKKILLWAPTQIAAKPTGCLFYHKLFQVTMDQDAKHSQVEISLDVTRVSTLPSALIYWGRHRPSRQNNTPAAPTPGSARATRTETRWVLQASERRSSHSTPAPSPVSRSNVSPPLLPLHHPTHPCSQKQTCSWWSLCHRTAWNVTGWGRGERGGRGGGEARDEEAFKDGASAFQACCKEMPWWGFLKLKA